MSTYARSTCDTRLSWRLGAMHSSTNWPWNIVKTADASSDCQALLIGMLLLFHGHRRREKMSQVLHKQCQRSVTKRFSLSYIIVHYPVTSLGEVNESICARHYCDDGALSHPSRALWTRKGQSDSKRKVELKGTHWKRTQGPPRSERTLH